MRNRSNFFVLVLAGIFIGIYWYEPITNFLNRMNANEPIAVKLCPSPEIVVNNQNNSGSFQANTEEWRIDYHGWNAPEKIGFMQALFNDTDGLTCYYQWQNPKEPGTNLWMTVKLLPTVTQTIHPYGAYWKKVGEHEQLCSGGVNACAYKLTDTAPPPPPKK